MTETTTPTPTTIPTANGDLDPEAVAAQVQSAVDELQAKLTNLLGEKSRIATEIKTTRRQLATAKAMLPRRRRVTATTPEGVIVEAAPPT